MKLQHAIEFLLVICILCQVLSSPVNNFHNYDPNSIDQNEKILKLLYRLVYHTENRIIRLKNEERIRFDNKVDDDLKNITVKDILQEDNDTFDIKDRIFVDIIGEKNLDNDKLKDLITVDKLNQNKNISALFRSLPNDDNQHEEKFINSTQRLFQDDNNNSTKINIIVGIDDKLNSQNQTNSSLINHETIDIQPRALKLVQDNKSSALNDNNSITNSLLEMKFDDVANNLIDVLRTTTKPKIL
ncbi:hypothetical protein HCN44_010501 [Aphidius gifuensis]|uniref:Venom protein n=1 Tax=Aphidius gifuensis TaxID=684658 RepID=A0A835CSX1_APHGI|nr:uncharacterized protein LOC122855599 [Aphidius gifuensis]KAF7991700.1 hypothetical protein HCN44_010501 [Aphidius gifuensis]